MNIHNTGQSKNIAGKIYYSQYDGYDLQTFINYTHTQIFRVTIAIYC